MNTHLTDIEYYNKWLNLAREIVLSKIDIDKYAVFLYGSMVNDPLKAYDMDIGIIGKEKVSFDTIENIKEGLDESIVPFRYDIIDFIDADEEFKKYALMEIRIWNKPDYIELK